jgi:hypothetical protein
MSTRTRLTRAERVVQQLRQLRYVNWPDVGDDQVWSRKRSDGFCTMPRTMPIFLNIMDSLEVGQPLGSTYLTLWARTSDEGVLVIQYPKECAMEAGFKGQRAEGTWIRRMRLLRKHGFIMAKAGPSGEFHYVLILNPFRVVQKLAAADVNLGDYYPALMLRASQVGADDLLVATLPQQENPSAAIAPAH